jgi:predicted nucleic acid-binding protein
MQILARANIVIKLDDHIELRARHFLNQGIKALDALHLAAAEKGKAHYFCTCDDKLLQKAKKIRDLHVKMISPIHLIEEIDT